MPRLPRTIVPTLALAMMLTVPAIPVHARTDNEVIPLSTLEEAQSRSFMTEYGVPRQTQDKLIAELRPGDFGDASDPSALPISSQIFYKNGQQVSLQRYSDGSIAVTEEQQPTTGTLALSYSGDTVPQAVTGCAVTSGSGFSVYRNCKVHYRSHVFSYGFYGTFTKVQGGYDKIDAAWGQFQDYAIGHSRDSWSLNVYRPRESSTGAAGARLTINYNILPHYGQITKRISLHVGSDTYWQQN